MPSIAPFVFLPDRRIVVCSQCRHACIGNEIERHLSGDQHKTLPSSARQPIAKAVRELPGIICEQSQLDEFAFPDPVCAPIPILGPPWADGVACNSCIYIVRSVKKIKEHYRQEHGWINSRKKGGQKKHAEVPTDPWREGVQCQRFFPTRKASRYFEVLQAATGMPARQGGGEDRQRSSERQEGIELADSVSGDSDSGIADAEPGAPSSVLAVRTSPSKEAPNSWLQALTQRSALLDQSASRAIHEVDEKLEPNPWLRRVGWARHLEGFITEKKLARLRSTLQPPGPKETVLQALWDSYVRVADEAQKQVCSLDAGAATLFEMARDTEARKHTPFQPRMAKDAWVRYRVCVGQLLLYLWRTQQWPDADRPAYRLTPQQSEFLCDLERLLEPQKPRRARPPFEEGSKEQNRLDDLVPQLLLALFDHHYHTSAYESVVISGLAVMGIRDDDGWVDVSDYTMRYSAVIKVVRIMVVARSITEAERDLAARAANGQDREEAIYSSQSLFERVRQRMDGFMLRSASKSPPSVMDWILSARTYGMSIAFGTPADGHIQWDDHDRRVSYKRIQFTMDSLREMVAKLIEETKALVGDALCLETDATTQAYVGFPVIPWDALEDDQSDTRLGHWFVRDERNPWPVSRVWLAESISKQPKLWRRWTRAPRAPGQPTTRPKASAVFNKLVDSIRGRLLILMHISGGGPGRSAEILNLRIWNTRQGGTRNIFIYHKMVCLVTKYHKGYLATDKLKVVYRFLPREIGELLVWYLWLVLPFWQAINSVAQQADYASPFLFGQNAVYGMMPKEQETKEPSPEPLVGPNVFKSMAPVGNTEDGDELEEEESGFRDGSHMTWSGDKMRRLLKEHTGRFMGVEVNIIEYRHIWIAISRKYMLGDSQIIAFQDRQAQGAEDKTIDLMTTHSSFTGDVVYAREAINPFSTGSSRHAFEKESKRWHRFLGLGLLEGMMLGKRRLEPFDQDGDKARFKRQKRLAEVDLRGRLRQMLDDPGAEFRPGQERVLQAIHKGYSPVLQVVGTGSGKSLSFMLPAYCGGDGVTVVIEPLIALREDMVKRCDALQIRNLVWSPGFAAAGSGTETASVVFVTPESAVHASFATYLRLLRARSRLDRIVVDECHMVLDSASPGSRFRPAFLKIGEMLAEYGVQIILLTATLSPRDQASLFAHIQIEPQSAVVFRSSTSRKNIAYSVCEVVIDEEDDVEEGLAGAVEEELAQASERFPSGRFIVYCGTVARTAALGKRLECPAYFHAAGTTREKTEMLEDWVRTGGVITATNALGVGLDIPDIRAVLHVTPPRRLRDFAQESGRAGRDGLESKSVIIRRQTGSLRAGFQQQHPTPAPRVESSRQARQRVKETRARAEAARKATALEFIEDEMTDYLETTFCRRAVVDEIMDGDKRADGCDGDAEQLCDLCRDRQEAEMEPSSEEEGDLAILQDNLYQQAATSAAAQRNAQQARRREGQDWTTFARMLPLAYGICMICADPEEKLDEQWRHSRAECPMLLSFAEKEPEESQEYISYVQHMQGQIQKDVLGRGLEAYAGCRKCGLPQSLCDSWEEDPTDGGRFLPSREKRECQFDGMLARTVADAMLGKKKACFQIRAQLQNMTGEEMDTETSYDPWYKWLGARTIWAGNETNNLCLFVSQLISRLIKV